MRGAPVASQALAAKSVRVLALDWFRYALHADRAMLLLVRGAHGSRKGSSITPSTLREQAEALAEVFGRLKRIV